MEKSNLIARKWWVRRHPIKTAFLCVGMGVFIVLPVLNYSGMCVSEGRWLSDDEKIRNILSVVTQNERIAIKTEKKGTQYFNKAKKESVDDFLENNSNCCAVNPKSGPYDLPPPTFMQRVTGFNAAEPIEIKYQTSYVDENGDIKNTSTKEIYLLTNCGKIRD